MGREMALLRGRQGWCEPLELDTLYVGGGTPSMIGEGAMAELALRLGSGAALRDGGEWTSEANPESLSATLAADWRAAGVNRLSIGVQTFHPPSLRWMGRLHGAGGARAAVAIARSAGFENLSIDLIFGLPAHLDRDWAADLAQALLLEPDHISLYGLTAEPGAALGRWVREGRQVLPDEEQYADEYLLAHEVLTSAGFEHYEVSNFCRPGARSRHNRVYWGGLPYAALGPGSHQFFPPVRNWNLRSWSAYRDAILGGNLPIGGSEVVAPAEDALERTWLSLRTAGGFPLAPATAAQRACVRTWCASGLATVADDSVRLSADGWLLLDRLALDLYEAGMPLAATAA